jgi:hypothetical protein
VGLSSRSGLISPGHRPRNFPTWRDISGNQAASVHLDCCALLDPYFQQDYLQISTSTKIFYYSYDIHQLAARISHSAGWLPRFQPFSILDSICCHNNLLAILYPEILLAVERPTWPLPCFHFQSLERYFPQIRQCLRLT